MKTNAIIRIVLFSLAILILGSILLGVIAFDSFMFSGDSVQVNDEFVVTDGMQSRYVANASDIQHLEIEWAAGNITILPDSNSDQILIRESEVSKEKYAMHISQSGNKLKIEFNDEDGFYIGIGSNELDSKDLVISVPADWVCHSLEIEAAATDVKVSGLTIREVDFDGASGICNFSGCSIDKMEIDTASGDVDFSGTLETLDFDAMSARFTGSFQNTPNRIDVDSMSGDLELTLPEDCGFTLNLDALSGNFQSDFITETYGSSHNHGDGRCKINVSAMSGDVNIHKYSHTHNDNCYAENSTCPDYGTHHDQDHH